MGYIEMHEPGFYEKYIKRLIDIICCSAFLVVFWWLYIILAVLVMIKLGRPVLFKQARPGKDVKIFMLYKFRSMTDARDQDGNLLPDSERLPSFGKMLRKSSLDELPELFNIIKGDMSIIGPRPLLVQYLSRYNQFQHRRHEVCPGLTGYAQAYGRNSLTWEEKFEKDVYYVDHLSFGLDVRILFKTIVTVFKREGISSETSATMEVFMGTKENNKFEKNFVEAELGVSESEEESK